MFEEIIKSIKEDYSDMAKQKVMVQNAVNNCMNNPCVEPTVKIEHIDASGFFPELEGEIRCFRQRFTENGITFSWWGLGIEGKKPIYGLEKTEGNNGDFRIDNLWLSEIPSSDNQLAIMNLIRMGIHNDLF